MSEEQVRALVNMMIDERLAQLDTPQRYTFQKNIQIYNGRNIQLGKGLGTKIGTESTQKIGFFGATPVVQQTAAVDLAGGTDTDGALRAEVVKINATLSNLGLTA